MNPAILIWQGHEGFYLAQCAALPGCFITASTRSEAQERIAEAIRGYIDHMAEVLPAELARLHGVSACRGSSSHAA